MEFEDVCPKKTMLSVIDRVLEIPIKRLWFSEVAPLPEGNWRNACNFGLTRISVPLEGGHFLYICRHGEWKPFFCPVGEGLIFVPDSWTANAPLSPGQQMVEFGVVRHPEYLRLIYSVVTNRDGEIEETRRLVFHLQKSLRPATITAFDLLGELSENSERDTPSGEFLHLALRMARADLAVATEFSGGNPQRLWNSIRSYMVNHFRDPLCREDVAEVFGISTVYLSKIFFRYGGGISFNVLLNNIRLNVAARLLVSTDRDCEKIAFECGYCDPSYFGARFRRRFNCTPLEYRRQNRRGD